MSDEPESAAWIDEIEEGHRPCPVCGRTMHIERKSAVSIEACPEHGIWLDKGELEAITNAVRRRGRRSRRDAVQRARRDGKVKGAFFGFWALLFD